jgi:hypothetical protein
MMFSAQSFSLKSPPVDVVPFIGAERTREPSRAKKSSGDADAIRISSDGSSITAEKGAGFAAASRSPNASIDASWGSGADNWRVRFTWYTSPAAMELRMS